MSAIAFWPAKLGCIVPSRFPCHCVDCDRETIQLMFAEEVHSLEFPSPWLKQHPTTYRRSRRDGRVDDVRIVNAFDEAFARELRHFHDCIVDGVACRTPPEDARLDIDVLTKMFLASAR